MPTSMLGDALGGRARVAQRVGVAVEVVLVDELAVAGDQDAADLLEFSGANGGIEGAQVYVRKAALSGGCGGPTSGWELR